MKSLGDLANDAARQFLKSAVFIDDRIYDRPSGRPVDPAGLADLPRARKPVTASVTDTSALPLAIEAPPPFHPRDIVGSFANAGIVCALYEPIEGFNVQPSSELFQLCEAADVVIIDWDFFNDDGAKMKTLVVELLKKSVETLPHNMRLVVVYTTDKSLLRVTNALFEALQPHLSVETVGATCLSSGSSRIAVFGKDGISRAEAEKAFTVKEADLAARVITEFATMNLGLLPSWALIGMASVRRNAGRILDRFGGQLDGAFLLQRALCMGTDDAFEQLPPLLAEEFLAVIEDEAILSGGLGADVASIAIGELKLNEPNPQWRDNGKGKAISADGIARDFLTSGVKGLDGHKTCIEAAALRKAFPKISDDTMAALTSIVDSAGIDSSGRLAELFSVRTNYSTENRTLGFGTIVREQVKEVFGQKGGWVYSISLMPLCDSLRLEQEEGGVAFPFWRLDPGVRTSSGGGRGLVVSIDGGFARLTAKGKPKDKLWIERFGIDAATKTVRASREEGGFILVGKSRRLEWVAQLKPLHAQRVANDIGQSLSRVGLSESEWVRLLLDR